MKGSTLIYLFVILWAAAFAGSILMAVDIDGPRNLDTGFKRLDVLARGQLLALLLAVVSAAAGFLVRDGGPRQKLIGLIPIGLTVIGVLGIVVLVLFRPEPAAVSTLPPSTPTTITAEPVQPAPAED